MKYFTFCIISIPLVTALWPIPSSYSHGNSVLWIEKNVPIIYRGPNSKASRSLEAREACADNHPTEPLLTRNSDDGDDEDDDEDKGGNASGRIAFTAIARFRKSVFEQNYVPWMFHPRGSDFEPSSGSSKTKVKLISLLQSRADPKNVLKPKAGEVDESYTLDMDNDGEVTIEAPSALGLAHGLTTLSQFFYATVAGDGYYTKLAPVKIKDKPKFAHRGLNLDTSRTYKPVWRIKKTIDALAYNKLNRLHVHVTDSQSWPLVITNMRSLAAKGAYYTGMVYTPAQVKDIQQYGSLRGVQVIFEIDMPGHTASIHHAYPDLIAAFNVQPNWNDVALEPPSGTLKLNSSAVYSFLDKLWDDLLPRVFPYSSYFHTGGDEVSFNAYLRDETVKSNKLSVLRPLIQKLTDHNHRRIRKEGMTPMVWEEMLLDYGIKLGKDVVIQTWQSNDAVRRTVEKGHKALVGNYNFWYLDCGKGQWLDFAPGASSAAGYPYLDYCNPLKNWRLIYSYDPLEGVPADLHHLVLGGETHIWSEQTDGVSLDHMVWPRTSAAAEVLWSGAKDAQGQNRSQIDASPRLSDMRERLLAMGIDAEPVRMPFCQMEKEVCVA